MPYPTISYFNRDIKYDAVTGLFWWLRSGKGRYINRPAGTKVRGYVSIRFGPKAYRAHRLAWLFMTGQWPVKQLDHINGTPDDNRWCNLRLANHTQQRANSQVYINNTSGFKGVSWHKEMKRWRADIRFHRKRIHLGCYNTREEAHAAYVKAAKKHFGEFARAR